MGCCVCHERPDLAAEARDETKAPPHNKDWVERMLLDIGLDLTSVARDFPRMSIATDKNGPPPHTDDFQKRLEIVRMTLRNIIELSESGVEGVENSHYYTLKAAALGSPVNIASTNADSEEILEHDESEAGSSQLRKSTSGHQKQNVKNDDTPLVDGNVSTPTQKLTTTNVAQVPVAGKVLEGVIIDVAGKERQTQQRRVVRLLERFDEEWDKAVSSIKTSGAQTADLHQLLMEVFDGALLCKKVILTKSQHRKFLNAKWREVGELSESIPSGEGRTLLSANINEEASKVRLGLVGELELNETQKIRKFESTQKLKQLMKANDFTEEEFVENSSIIISPSDLPNPDVDGLDRDTTSPGEGVAPQRNTTGLPPKKQRSTVTPNSQSSRSRNPQVSSFGADFTIQEDSDGENGERLPLLSGRSATPNSRVSPRLSPQGKDKHNHFAPIPFPDEETDDVARSLGDIKSPATPRKTLSGIVMRPPSKLSPASTTPTKATPAAQTVAGSAEKEAKRETWISNSRAMDVLFYFNQGVMFYPSQRIRYLFWFPWVSTLRDVSWESRIYTEDTTLAEFLSRSKPGSPTRKGSINFSQIHPNMTESPFFPHLHRHTEPTDEDAGNHKGLIFISHMMTNRNYVREDQIGNIPEFQVSWSVEIVLDKNGYAEHKLNEDTNRMETTTELEFIDARLVVRSLEVKEPPNRIASCSNRKLWMTRKRLLVDHVYNSFKIQHQMVKEFSSTGSNSSDKNNRK